VLAQQAVGRKKPMKSPPFPTCCRCLDIAGAIVFRLMRWVVRRPLPKRFIDAKADYVLALKDNHKGLCEDVSLWLDTETAAGRLPLHETVDKDHGRFGNPPLRFKLPRSTGSKQKPDWKRFGRLSAGSNRRGLLAIKPP